jgi:hypothetical protein
MKMMSYFKKHFVTRVRNFVFTYRKSIERKCHTTVIIINAIYLRYLILCYTNLFSELSRESHGRAFREGDFI